MSSFDLKNADSSATGSSATVGYQQSPVVSFANQGPEKTEYHDSFPIHGHTINTATRGIQKSIVSQRILPLPSPH